MDRISKITEAARAQQRGVAEANRANSALKTLTEHQRRRENAA